MSVPANFVEPRCNTVPVTEHDPAPWRSYWVEAVLVIVLIVGPATWLAVATDAQHGNVADWVAAMATLGALIAALIAASYAHAALKREHDRDRWRDEQQQKLEKQALDQQEVEQRTQRRAQASRISAWPAEVVRGTSSDVPWVVLQIAVRNASDLPISRVYAGIRDPFSWEQTQPRQRLDFGLVPPESSVQLRGELRYEEIADVPSRHEIAVDLLFTDSSGVTWFRDVYGRLSEVPDALPPGFPLFFGDHPSFLGEGPM